MWIAPDPAHVLAVAADAFGQLQRTGHAFVEYTPGDGMLYRTLIAYGPREQEWMVAVPSLDGTAFLPREQLHRDYVAAKVFGQNPTAYNWEVRTGVLTDLLNAITGMADGAALDLPEMETR